MTDDTELPTIDIDGLVALGGGTGGVPVVDVRQPDEYVEGHVPGALLVPLADVPDRLGDFPTDRTVYVVCKSGGRSANAVAFLRTSGLDAVNVAGGTMAWIDAGHPVVEGGEPG